MSGAPALTFREVSRSFGKVKALNELSFSIPKNSVAALVGANGAGKTTTFSLIGQFIKCNSGAIEVHGQPLSLFRRSGGLIGLLPQDMQYFEDRSVSRQLYLFARLAGLSSAEAKVELERVLQLVSLKDKVNARAGDLSHGMRVRLGVAQALIASPSLVLLDEPTAGLDPRMQMEFRETINTIRGKSTVVISSHDLGQLQEMCDYCVIIDKGQLLKQGPMSRVLGASDSLTVRYKVEGVLPAIDALMQRLPKVEISLASSSEMLIRFEHRLTTLASLNKLIIAWLQENDLAVLEIIQEQKLEKVYLEATVGKSK